MVSENKGMLDKCRHVSKEHRSKPHKVPTGQTEDSLSININNDHKRLKSIEYNRNP
jgi:hypothetical protein